MHLAAMMRLMIEKMRQRGIDPLLDLRRLRDRAIRDCARQLRLIEPIDEADDASSSRITRRAQIGEGFVQDRIEPRRRLALAGETLHPDAVGDEQMVERAVNRFEEGTPIGAIIGIAELRG